MKLHVTAQDIALRLSHLGMTEEDSLFWAEEIVARFTFFTRPTDGDLVEILEIDMEERDFSVYFYRSFCVIHDEWYEAGYVAKRTGEKLYVRNSL